MNPKAFIYIAIVIGIFMIGCKLTIFSDGQYKSKYSNVPFSDLVNPQKDK